MNPAVRREGRWRIRESRFSSRSEHRNRLVVDVSWCHTSVVMSWRRLTGLGAVMTALLISAGLGARGRPLASHGSISAHAGNVLMVVAALVVAGLVVAFAFESHRAESSARRPWGVGDVFFALLLIAALTAGAYGLGRAFHPSALSRNRGLPCASYEQAHGRATSKCAGPTPQTVVKPKRHVASTRSPRSWAVIGGILALLLVGGGLFLFDRRRRLVPATVTHDGDRRVVLDALDLSLDDLRRDPDAGRAIVAAYARMERAFAVAGVPRKLSEAPHEFLARSLHEIDASAEAASRLTELFELAKFSNHAATAVMREEALDALTAVRDELREGLAPPDPTSSEMTAV